MTKTNKQTNKQTNNDYVYRKQKHGELLKGFGFYLFIITTSLRELYLATQSCYFTFQSLVMSMANIRVISPLFTERSTPTPFDENSFVSWKRINKQITKPQSWY